MNLNTKIKIYIMIMALLTGLISFGAEAEKDKKMSLCLKKTGLVPNIWINIANFSDLLTTRSLRIVCKSIHEAIPMQCLANIFKQINNDETLLHFFIASELCFRLKKISEDNKESIHQALRQHPLFSQLIKREFDEYDFSRTTIIFFDITNNNFTPFRQSKLYKSFCDYNCTYEYNPLNNFILASYLGDNNILEEVLSDGSYDKYIPNNNYITDQDLCVEIAIEKKKHDIIPTLLKLWEKNHTPINSFVHFFTKPYSPSCKYKDLAPILMYYKCYINKPCFPLISYSGYPSPSEGRGTILDYLDLQSREASFLKPEVEEVELIIQKLGGKRLKELPAPTIYELFCQII